MPVHYGSGWDYAFPGLLRLERDTLVLEYRSGFFRSKVKENVIPLKDVRSLQVKCGWFSTRLIVRTSSLKTLEGIPRSEQGQVSLSLARRDLETAERILAAIQRQTSAIEIDLPSFDGSEGEANHPPQLPAAAPASPGRIRRKLGSLVNSVYTMFFSRHKNADSATNEPVHEHPTSKP